MSSSLPRSATRLAKASLAEAHRALTGLRAPGHRAPYYVSYLIRDEERTNIEARFGSLFSDDRWRTRTCFADVRVGSYRYDHVREGGLHDNSTKAESYAYTRLPVGDSLDGIRHGLWELTESRYRDAAESLLEKRADELHYRNPNRGLPAFERREGTKDRVVRPQSEIDRDYWVDYVTKASALAKKVPGVHQSAVHLEVRDLIRVFVSTEDSVIIETRQLWWLDCALTYTSEEGVNLPWNLTHFAQSAEELPSLAQIRKEIRGAFATLVALAKAPTIQAYSGPVLLDPKPAGLLMHEAIGHRLEGSRLLSQGEGRTLRDFRGRQLLPPYLSMRDDPTLESYDGSSLVGAYTYDDEGIEAQPCTLIEGGEMKGFLTSRVPIGKRHESNGHARNASFERPMSRMGVTVVKSEGGLSDAELKARLIEEVKARGLPFGIHVLAADSGETATKAYDFQAFLGNVRLATRVFPDGRQELVRGVNFVGTPLNAVRGIRAAGSRHEVDNSYCGAESGSVPVSTISPGLLLSDLELQTDAKQSVSPHTYPIPWAE